MAVGIIQQIIKKGVSNQITFNIMDLKDFKKIWNKLKSVYTKVIQGVVYLILQKLLYYLKITKPKRYEKLVIQIFAEVKYFCKCFHIVMTLGRDLWDIIAIVIAFDSLYKDFNTTIASLLEINNKIIDQI